MHPAVLTSVLLLALATGASAADAGADLRTALAGADAAAKKSAIRAVGSSGAGKDDDVLPALIGAIADRQAGEAAVSALQSRTGKLPVGGLFKTGEDPAKIQAAWQGWYEDWKKAQQIKKLEKKEPKSEAPVAPQAVVEVPKTEEKIEPPKPAEDLGKLDRVVFKAGGSLLCYVMSKRTDADGNLVSVRVVHPDGRGEETITADLVARIEEDIR